MTELAFFLAGCALLILPVEPANRLRNLAFAPRANQRQTFSVSQWFRQKWVYPPELPPSRRRNLCLLLGFFCFALGSVWKGLILGVIFAIVVTTLMWLTTGAWESRRIDRDYRALLLALDALAGDLRAGSSPDLALRRASSATQGAPRHILSEVAGISALGGQVPVALAEYVEQCRSKSIARALQKLASAWQISSQTGASLGAVLDRVQQDLHARHRFTQQLTAQLAGARATAVLLAALPVLSVLCGMSFGADPVGVLFQQPIGRALLFIGVLLESVGMLWLSALLRKPLERA